MRSTSQKTFKIFNAKLFFIVSSFNMDLNDELVIFNTFFFLGKMVDPSGFHILEQLVAFGVEKINQLLKFC